MQVFEGGAVKSIFVKNRKFFNFELGDGLPPIIDYLYFDKEFPLEDGNILEFYTEKKKTKINSIAALRSILEELVFDAAACLYECTISNCNISIPCDAEDFHSLAKKYFSIDPEYHELLVNQLIADVLCEKYLDETYMTLNKYCEEHFYVNYLGEWKKPNEFELNEDGNAIYTKGNKGNAYKMMARKIKSYNTMMSIPEKKEELINRGFDPDSYAEYIEKKGERKPKWIFDLIYYDEALKAFKLYKRDAWDGSDKAYKQYAKDLIDYDKFVEKAFRPIEGCDKDYFHKSMSRYYLESISSLEFIYKLAERLEKESVTDERIIYFLTNLYSNDVSCPIIKEEPDGSAYLRFIKKVKNYASAPFIEAAWLVGSDYRLDEMENNPFHSLLGRIRVQARELFFYHYAFESDDYEDISSFIKNDFNILDKLHDKQKMWHGQAGVDPLSDKQKERIDRIRMVEGVIFHKFDAMKASAFISSPENDKEENYQKIFGMSRETFTKILSSLESAHTKLYVAGGRPSNMNLVDKLAIAEEYFRYDRTVGGMASHYGVSKRQISEAKNWIIKTLVDDGSVDI